MDKQKCILNPQFFRRCLRTFGKEDKYWERLKDYDVLEVEVRTVVMFQAVPAEHFPVLGWGATAITLIILNCYIFAYRYHDPLCLT